MSAGKMWIWLWRYSVNGALAWFDFVNNYVSLDSGATLPKIGLHSNNSNPIKGYPSET